METSRNLIKVATIAMVMAVTSFSVQAQQFDSKDVAVRVYDLDLSNSADASVLLSRIRHAVKLACTRAGDARDMKVARDRANCLEASYSNTISAINGSHGVDVEAIAALPDQTNEVASARE